MTDRERQRARKSNNDAPDPIGTAEATKNNDLTTDEIKPGDGGGAHAKMSNE